MSGQILITFAEDDDTMADEIRRLDGQDVGSLIEHLIHVEQRLQAESESVRWRRWACVLSRLLNYQIHFEKNIPGALRPELLDRLRSVYLHVLTLMSSKRDLFQRNFKDRWDRRIGPTVASMIGSSKGVSLGIAVGAVA
jgi:hypothetical protein